MFSGDRVREYTRGANVLTYANISVVLYVFRFFPLYYVKEFLSPQSHLV